MSRKKFFFSHALKNTHCNTADGIIAIKSEVLNKYVFYVECFPVKCGRVKIIIINYVVLLTTILNKNDLSYMLAHNSVL